MLSGDAVGFLRENRDLQPLGNGEFLLASYRQNRVTACYDVKDRLVRYTVCLPDRDSGEVRTAVYESKDAAIRHFAEESEMLGRSGILLSRESLAERLREKLLRYLLSKSKQQSERP